jgi:hypothetical protein
MKPRQYPIFYFDGGYPGGLKSDREFIHARMAHIPETDKDRVSMEYEKIYMGDDKDSRREANEFLHRTASKYRDKQKEESGA